jgi:hypothetical protein
MWVLFYLRLDAKKNPPIDANQLEGCGINHLMNKNNANIQIKFYINFKNPNSKQLFKKNEYKLQN